MQPGGGAGINIWPNRYTPAGGWGTAHRISDGLGGAQGDQAVAIDARAHATAVWQQADNIWSNRYVPGVGWLTPEVIDLYAGWSGSPQIAVDGSGNMLAVWMESRNGRLNIEASRYIAGAGWDGTHTLDSDNTGTSASVANPSWTHSSTTTACAVLVIHSGLQTMTNTPATNWTLIGSADRSAIGWGAARRTHPTHGALRLPEAIADADAAGAPGQNQLGTGPDLDII